MGGTIMHFHGFNGMGWGMGFGWIIGAVVLAVIIWLLVRMVNQNNSANSGKDRSALDVLKERYARGEIDKKEFEEKKRDLS